MAESDASVTVACIGILIILYVLGMFFQYRQLLYHVWNHIIVALFVVYFLQLALLIWFVLVPNGMSCLAWVTTMDACRGAATILLLALFFVFMFPPCFEPERRKLFGFELMLFGGIIVWILAQISVYAATGKFAEDGTHLCRLRFDQTILAGIFVIAPSFVDFFGSAIFIWWLKTRDVMLRRNRVNRFAWMLFFSCVLKVISSIGEIKNAIDLSNMNSTQVKNEEQSQDDAHDEIFFFIFIFYFLHVFFLAVAVIYGEDLIPRWLRQPNCFTKMFCCCVVADEEEWAEQENQALMFAPSAAGSQNPTFLSLYGSGYNNNSNTDPRHNNNNNNKNERKPMIGAVDHHQKNYKDETHLRNDDDDRLIILPTNSTGSLNDHNYGAVHSGIATSGAESLNTANASNNINQSTVHHQSPTSNLIQEHNNNKGEIAQNANDCQDHDDNNNKSNERTSMVSHGTTATTTLSQQIVKSRDPRSIRHTLTYFLMMIRNDIVTHVDDNNVPSSVIRSSASDYNKIAGSVAGSGGGLTSVPNYHAVSYDHYEDDDENHRSSRNQNKDDDEISRSSLFHRNNNYSEKE